MMINRKKDNALLFQDISPEDSGESTAKPVLQPKYLFLDLAFTISPGKMPNTPLSADLHLFFMLT
jgi:hypothetical protein